MPTAEQSEDQGRIVLLPAIVVVSAGVLAVSAFVVRTGVEPGGYDERDVAVVQQPLDFEFYRESIEPVFVRPRGGFQPGEVACAACHTWQATTPLKLQPLETDENGSVYWTEEQSRQNFEVVSRLVTPGDPDNSRLLRKPLAPEAGGAARHTGGVFWDSTDDPEWQVMAEWVRQASPVPPEEVPVPDFTFFRDCVQPVFTNPIQNAVGCTECHAGGNGGFARPPANQTSWTEAEASESYEALMAFIEPGYPEYSRFLYHPLSRDGGGDFMHNGGRRWQSTDDPEWQALASWIRGDLSGGSCPAALQFN